jgi:hypothetical protein
LEVLEEPRERLKIVGRQSMTKLHVPAIEQQSPIRQIAKGRLPLIPILQFGAFDDASPREPKERWLQVRPLLHQIGAQPVRPILPRALGKAKPCQVDTPRRPHQLSEAPGPLGLSAVTAFIRTANVDSSSASADCSNDQS